MAGYLGNICISPFWTYCTCILCIIYSVQIQLGDLYCSISTATVSQHFIFFETSIYLNDKQHFGDHWLIDVQVGNKCHGRDLMVGCLWLLCHRHWGLLTGVLDFVVVMVERRNKFEFNSLAMLTAFHKDFNKVESLKVHN